MTFLFPIFLAGLGAILLPWILHRFSRETPPATLFPSTRFLEASRAPVSRKKRLRHLGLFSLRTLFLLALCLLFAQPYCSTAANRAKSQANTFVVVDRSASMQAGERWSRAQSGAAEALREGASSSAAAAPLNSVQLFDMASTLTAHGELSSDLSLANAALRDLQVSAEPGDYGIMMQQLDTLAAEQELPVDVVFISDAQRSNLPLQPRQLRTQNIRNFAIQSVADNETNLAIQGNASSTDGVNVAVSLRLLFSTTAEKFADAQVADLIVTAGERTLASEQVTLQANDPQAVVLEDLILPSTDTDFLNARLIADSTGSADALSIDSSINIPVQQVTPVVVGMRALGTRMPADASLFLRTALTTDAMARVVSASGSGAALSNDAKHWILFSEVDESGDYVVTPVVEDLLNAGGNVMLILQPSSPESDEPDEAEDYIGSVDVAHPLALGELDWQHTRIYSPVTVNLEPNDRVLIRSGQGLPLIIERTRHDGQSQGNGSTAGRFLIVTDPLDGIASDLPLQEVFVEWIAQTIQWFDANSAFPTTLEVGESVSLPANAQLLAPDGRAMQSLADASKATRLLLKEPGIYTVVTGVSEHTIQATVAWEESILVAIDNDYMAKWTRGELSDSESTASENMDATADELGQRIVASGNALETGSSPSAAVTSERLGRSWWPWLLPLLALSLLTESLLANRRLAVRRDGL